MLLLGRSTAIQQYTDAWAETDPTRQRACLAHCWTPDSTYEDLWTPMVRGQEALLAVIKGFHQTLPGARIMLNSELETYRHVGRFNWILHPPEGSPTYGADFVEFNAHNQLVRVVGFFSYLARWQY